MRAITWNLMLPWLRPPSAESRIFSTSVMIGSGPPYWTGKMPTDCPRIQSTSKLSVVSMVLRRSGPVPWISTMLRTGSARTMPGLMAKLSSSFTSAVAETYCNVRTETPFRHSALPVVPYAGMILRADVTKITQRKNKRSLSPWWRLACGSDAAAASLASPPSRDAACH
jgi:hypothetical protein